MPFPLIVYGLGLGVTALLSACNDDENVRRDSDEQDVGVLPEQDATPPEPVVSSCEFPAQGRLSLDGKALLACAKNPGTRFEVFDGQNIQQYDVPVNPPSLLPGREIEAESVQNFAIDGADGALFVLTRYAVEGRTPGKHIIDSILSVYREGELEPRAQKTLELGHIDTEGEVGRVVELRAIKDRTTGEVNVNVLQADGGVSFSRFRFHGFEAENILEKTDAISMGELAIAEDGRVLSALFPTRFSFAGYKDPLILVKESALQVASLDLVNGHTIDYTEPFLQGFHPTPAPSLDDALLRIPAPEASVEFLSGTAPWLMTIPGLSGKILVYSVGEAMDAHSVGGGNREDWQTLISLPTEEDVLHVTHTAQQFDEEGRVTNVGDLDYFALTASGAIFYFPLSDSLKPGQIAQVEGFDRTKVRGFFIMNNQFMIVLAGEEGNQFYTLPVPDLRVGPRISVE